MKALLKATAVVKSEKTNQKGDKTYYNIGLVQDGDLIEFSTNEDVFKNVKLYEPSSFELTISKGVYKGQVYESKSITAVIGK